MDSALTPREIQARIRAGEPVAEVAEAAGVSVESLAGFAGPVLAERAHMASNALSSTVRRKGESSGHRTLAAASEDVLRGAGLDPDSVEWDSWRDHNRAWHVTATYTRDGDEARAVFDFDHQRRFNVPANDAARWIIGEVGSAADEPTVDLARETDDELAIVRVVNDEDESEIDPDQALPEPMLGTGQIERPVIEGDVDDDFEDSVGTADFEENEDGTYEIIPPSTSDLDVLYDMLGGFNEDSVRIYAGLSEPPEGEPRTEPVVREPDPEPAEPEAQDQRGPLEPEQPDLWEDEEETPAPAPEPKSSRKRGRRASVPSWDEIMFGSPKRKN
ncbi:septation protein SepH [Parenemella sanctibonifatiensis]|uniref:DUF3071 domain-containing protein n=1 Tax=Parenemella sanctibonifatiensis TaxID=2016505 RepID=A0A255EAA9_9ACTN|nr:septation protein SepH [Parenemella sanctibonifatiensis]OYN86435.1 hypothetical protein CGZ92_08780 [Parenemella sanctibonifatiensis]